MGIEQSRHRGGGDFDKLGDQPEIGFRRRFGPGEGGIGTLASPLSGKKTGSSPHKDREPLAGRSVLFAISPGIGAWMASSFQRPGSAWIATSAFMWLIIGNAAPAMRRCR
ncbi:MAG: hypothetical protein R3F11_19860 [Verrucomicrobiales bacterium]